MTVHDLPVKVKDYLKWTQNQHRITDDARLYPTELIGCLKKAYLCRKHPCTMNLEGCYAVWRGKVIDEALSPLFERNQESVEYQPPGEEFMLAGRLDAVDPDGDIILDWKTVGNLHFIKKDGPKEDHKRQLMFYWEGLRQANPEDPAVQVDSGGHGRVKLVYMDMGDVETYIVHFTPEEAEENLRWLVTRAWMLHQALEANTPPPSCAKDSKENAWQCRYCSAVKFCIRGEKDGQ